MQGLKSQSAAASSSPGAAGSLRASGPTAARKAGMTGLKSGNSSFNLTTNTASSDAAAASQQQQQRLLQQHQEEVQSLRRELDMQRELLAKLRSELEVRDEQVRASESAAVPRPTSRELLAPMDVDDPSAVGSSHAAARLGSAASTGRPSSASPSSRRVSGTATVLLRGNSSGRTGSAGGNNRPMSGLSAAVAAGAVGSSSGRERAMSGSGSTAADADPRLSTGMAPEPWETTDDHGAGGDWAAVAVAEDTAVHEDS